MENALETLAKIAYADLEAKKKGSIKMAQRTAKLLHKAGKTREASNLVRVYNKLSKTMPREDW
jgi:hypothetical protein